MKIRVQHRTRKSVKEESRKYKCSDNNKSDDRTKADFLVVNFQEGPGCACTQPCCADLCAGPHWAGQREAAWNQPHEQLSQSSTRAG